MNSLEILRREMDAVESDPDFVYEQLLLDVNERILTAMERAGVRKADLAERLGTSRAYITKLLGGPENLTLKTLVRVAMALNSRVELRFHGIARDALPALANVDHLDQIAVELELTRSKIEAMKKIRVKKKHSGARTPATKTRNVPARTR